MQVKGTAVKPTIEFVKLKFPDRYQEWLNALPENSQKIVRQEVNAALWYPVEEAFIAPTKQIAKLFYDNENDAAYELGIFSAEMGLKGVYKIFVRIASPKFVISRAKNIFASYYKPSVIKLEVVNDKLVYFNVYKFEKSYKIIAYRIAGWFKTAMKLTGCKNPQSSVEEITENNEPVFRIISSWE